MSAIEIEKERPTNADSPARRNFSFPLLIGVLLTAIACSHNPSIRKQKYFESGERYFQRGKYPEAAIQFSNAIQVDGKFSKAHYQLAITCAKMHQWAAAYREFSRVVELDPANYQAELDLTNLLIAAGDLKQAQQHAQSLLQNQPGNWEAHLAASGLLAAQSNLPAAIEEAKKAAVLGPDEWRSYLNLAVMDVKINDLNQGEISYKRAAALGPAVLEPQLALGRFYFSRERFTEAEKQFRICVEIDRSSPERYADLARVYATEGKRDEAESFLKSAVRVFPNDSAGYRLLGDFYFASRDFDKARAEYDSLYRDHPSDPQVKKNYVQVLILKNELELAQTLNDGILKDKPSDLDALIDRAQIQIRQGQFDRAMDALRMAIKRDSRNGLAHYYLGIALDAKGSVLQARGELGQAVHLDPNLTDAYRALAVIALRTEDTNGLEEAANHIISQEANAPEGYLYRAMSAISRKLFVQAEADLRKAAVLAPLNPDVHIVTGNLRVVELRFQEASLSYRKALDLDPRSSAALRGLMNVDIAESRPDRAIASARSQIAMVPDSSAFYDLLGTTLFFTNKDLEGAQAAFLKATQLDKNNSDAVLKLAQVQIAKGATNAAIATCTNWLTEHPGDPGFYILLGEIYESQKNWQDAKVMYQKALQIQPENAVASDNLAFVLLQTGGNVDLALDLAQSARRKMLDSPNAADTLGWVYYQKGVFKSAIDLFQEGLRLSEKNRLPDNATIHYHLALAFEKAGQKSLAREQLRRVLEISPNYNDAETLRKELAELKGPSSGQKQ